MPLIFNGPFHLTFGDDIVCFFIMGIFRKIICKASVKGDACGLSPKAREKSVVISLAVAEAVAFFVKGKGGNEAKGVFFHILSFYYGKGDIGFFDTEVSFLQLRKLRHLMEYHVFRVDTAGKANCLFFFDKHVEK